MLNYEDILKKVKVYYFNNIKKKKLDKIPDEYIYMKLYDLLLNILNQEVFNYQYNLTNDDITFVAKYNLNIYKIINFVN